MASSLRTCCGVLDEAATEIALVVSVKQQVELTTYYRQRLGEGPGVA